MGYRPQEHGAELAAPGSEAVLTDSRAQIPVTSPTFAKFRARSAPTISPSSPGGRPGPRSGPRAAVSALPTSYLRRDTSTYTTAPREGPVRTEGGLTGLLSHCLMSQ